MKKIYINPIYFVFIVLISYSCSTNKEIVNQAFYYSFASENNRMKGDMFLSNEFNYNLKSLTYDYYLNYLSDRLKSDEIKILKIVKHADKQYFESDTATFKIVLFYKNDRIIVYDNAETPMIDKVDTLKSTEKMPVLKDFIPGLKNK